ncbi:FAD/NAD(P)-binding domain-containing protein [Cryphonectria parasitica EP155]|uniref:FAD/NAD(P)-binding domain-containing protein n=1 Tax=Cryphonectria parasitica (strain ATCC 38755 / EP155) TaxID=660469 RepID=A0A9P4YAZ2_CRYP1|nr:FAD/NAD(P)-binding domain-containing protein [Cryphonectria parasitica EP155]KAF3770023.1 FAD/NAD(P)-binding domain-containing protein [Cryphonectria parasitica EP155]
MAASDTGIKVIVVGAGFGGLSAAIECHRQGHKVEIYESFPEHKILGDMITLGANAGRIIYRWDNGQTVRQLARLSINVRDYGFRIHKYDTGEIVFIQKHSPMGKEKAPADKGAPAQPKLPPIGGHRGELHAVIFRYARDQLGIPIHLGQNITEYVEDGDQAGIVLKTGEKIFADVVIGADGVRSKARDKVLGSADKPVSSGYAIWRAWFPTTDLATDPRTEEFCKEDTFNGWFGPDVHFLFCTIKGGKECCWFLTHKDDYEIQDQQSWSSPGNLEDVYKVLEGWDPLLKAIVEKTPAGHLNDWKLANWPPLATWIGTQGRTALLGDSAHPFLPTSAQGAAQAMEDAVTLAFCLKQAGKENVPAALRTYQDIRYERVKKLQKMGETNKDIWHKVDWGKVKENPGSIAFPREDWIYEFDAEKHAQEVFDDVFKQHTSN